MGSSSSKRVGLANSPFRGNKNIKYTLSKQNFYLHLSIMETIIVTGGAGYIGSHTIIELLNKTDYDVVAVDNFSNSAQESYDRIRAIAKRDFTQLNLELCDESSVFEKLGHLKHVAGIIHFAAFKSVPESVANP